MKTPALLLAGAVPPPHHGSTIYFEGLLHSKLRERFTVLHLDLSDHRDLSNLSKLDWTNVRLALTGIGRLIAMLVREKPDIVYIPFAASALPFFRDGLMMLSVRLVSRATLVVHFHGGEYFRDVFYKDSNPMVRWFIRLCLKRTDALITLGARLHGVFEGLAPHIVPVPNGIPLRRLPPPKPETSGIRIVFLANLIRSKGILDLLSAAERLLPHHPELEFHVIGDWWERDTDVKDAVLRAETTLQPHLVVHGQVLREEKFAILDASDIFVLPTSNDGFPISILEAMSAGLPVISSKDVGAIPDIVCDGETGILIPPGDVSALADALETLVRDPDRRRRMGEAGRKRYEEYFLDSAHYDRMIRVFESVLEI